MVWDDKYKWFSIAGPFLLFKVTYLCQSTLFRKICTLVEQLLSQIANEYFILYLPQNNFQIPLKKGNGEIFKIVTAAYEYEQKTYVLVFWQQAQGAFPHNVEIQISA